MRTNISRILPWLLTCSLFLLAAKAGRIAAQENFRVLPVDFNQDKSQQMMRSYLRKQVQQAMDKRLQELKIALESTKNLSAYQQKRREFLRWTLGEMPKRTLLNARVVGTINAEDYTIEKILFESQPGFHVSANLYRPIGPGPFPAILHSCGHSENGKAAAVYQKANILLAQNGFIVLCYDPIGQGERKQFFSPEGKPLLRASSEHQQLGVAAILLGRSLGSYMVWDGVRGIDYLCSRSDVDAKKIGCTGNSGGGNLTSFLMAYDERIQAAAPGCFMTTHRLKNVSPGPGDAEQNLFAQIRDGFDHPDFIIARAPKPTLILSATKDFVPIGGTWTAYRQAKRVYTQLGYPERVNLIETNEKHGFSRRLREGAVRFFARWLQDRNVEVFESDEVAVRTDEELQVTPKGQVRYLKRARSLQDLYAETELTLVNHRPALTLKTVRKVAGIRSLAEIPKPTVEVVTKVVTPQKIIIRPEPGIVLPALYWPTGKQVPVLIVSASGMQTAVNDARQRHAAGHPVLLVDPRDIGETRTNNWRFFGAEYYIAYMLGRSWLSMQAEDLLVSARWLAEQKKVKSVNLQVSGDLGPAALHAAVLEPGLIRKAFLEKSLESWRSLMKANRPHPHLHTVLNGVLHHYDLPDLIPFAGKKRIEIRQPLKFPQQETNK